MVLKHIASLLAIIHEVLRELLKIVVFSRICNETLYRTAQTGFNSL